MQRGDNMHEIKKGDIVSRNSYGNDIIFSVVRIMKNETRIALLKGIDVRIEADAPLTDLQIVSREEQIKREKELEQRILTMIEKEKKLFIQAEYYIWMVIENIAKNQKCIIEKWD